MSVSSIIPYLHFKNPLEKMKAAWCMEAVDYYWKHSANNVNLLADKKTKEIDEYYTGKFDMTPFIAMYKSDKKNLTDQIVANNPGMLINKDFTGIEAEPLPLIFSKVKSAIAIIQKVPIEISCKANDALAMQKKEEDIKFLVNKPAIEADLQEIADRMNIGKVDIGGTKNSDVEFGDSPFGLDMQDPDQRKIFSLLYSLNVETSFEKVLQQFYDLKKIQQIRLMEIIDQYKYGVSVHSAFTSSMTGLPDAEYVYPGNIITQESRLHDFSDNTARFQEKSMTAMDMFNFFSDEICGMEEIDSIVNGPTGYCKCNGINGGYDKTDYSTKKLNFVLCEIKSVDWVGVYEKPKSKRKVVEFTLDEEKCSRKIWGQNTYRFWWLKGTDYVFKIEKLGFTHRTRGQESFQNFSTSINRSSEVSPVEHSIGENKKAMIAEIKMFHAIAVSLPPGRVIDIKGMRSALGGLIEDGSPYTIQTLLDLALKKNIQIIDTTDWDGKNDGQLKPFYEVPGGIRTEVNGYMQVIQQCAANISKFTGINDQLAGQGGNDEGLVGMQKLLINSSINALNHIAEAIEMQYQNLMNTWANLVQKSIEAGGKTKEAIINMIGTDDVKLLDGLNEIPLHNLTIKVILTQREEERDTYRRKVALLVQQGLISTGDEMLLNQISNPKERMRFLVTKENIARKELERQKQLDRDALMERQKLANEGVVQATEAKTEGNIKEIFAAGEKEAKLLEMADKLGIHRDQLQFIGKLALQQDRGKDQLRKAERTVQAKEETKLNSPLPFV